MQFFGYFSDFFQFWTFKKINKIYKMDRKNEHQRFFLYFYHDESINGLVFFKNKMLFFFRFILDRIVSAGRCSRDILSFSIFVSKQVTFPLVFFDPHHAPRQISKRSFFLFSVSKQITIPLVFFEQ